MYDRRRASQARIFTATERTQVSVVVPVHDEEQNLLRLHARLSSALEKERRSWEVVYVDDGSRDGSLKLLRGLAAADPRVVTVELAKNFGQQAALLAGFERCSGDTIVTLDADLSHPPEEIAVLLDTIDHGYDLAAGRRERPPGSLWKRFAMGGINRLAGRLVRRDVTDWGCGMRAYRRDVVTRMLRSSEHLPNVTALAATCARRIAEVAVKHDLRLAGKSKHGLMRLLAMKKNLITGYSTAPLQLILVAGVATLCAGLLASGWLVTLALLGHAIAWPAALFAATASATGAILSALGVMAEYLARIHLQVLGRPRSVTTRIHQAGSCEIVEA